MGQEPTLIQPVIKRLYCSAEVTLQQFDLCLSRFFCNRDGMNFCDLPLRRGDRMRRREFAMLAGSFALLPSAGRGQGAPLLRVGVLMGTADDAEGQSRVAALKQGMRDLKWTEGVNITYDVRWTAGDAKLAQTLVAQLVAQKPDLILGVNTPIVRALRQSTDTIPVVFAGLSDPVGDGIVTSLARPGGNITGFSSFEPEMASKWLQLLNEIVPKLQRVAVMYNPNTAPHTLFWPTLEVTAPTIPVALVRATVESKTAIESMITGFASDRGMGLILLPDSFTASHREMIYELLERYRLPAIWPIPYHVASGGLIAYGPDFADQFRRSATYVDRILRGTSTPAELPVQQPVKFELKINLKVAKKLGLEVRPFLLALADEVIE
jgi:putative tryptophan/tyrosine transport system substrate-binding protein